MECKQNFASSATSTTLPVFLTPTGTPPYYHTTTGTRVTEELVAVVSSTSTLSKTSLKEREEEEREWNTIVSQPHVINTLRRLATEARQQDAAGETEEGGFALE